MGILQRYFWRQAFWPLVISLTALAALALLIQSLSTLDLIVENRQSAWTFFKVTLLALPQLIGIIMPLAVFMAIIYAINRLNTDSEMAVAKSVGTSPWDISNPFIRLACGAMIVHLLINLLVQPLSFRTMRQELLSVRTDLASQMVRPGEFVTPTPGMTFYAREALPSGRMSDVIIRDSRDTDNVSTYTAKSGYITRNENNEPRLTLENGIIQTIEDDGALSPVSFESYQIDLTEIMALDSALTLKSSDRFLHELLKPSQKEYTDKRLRQMFLAEGHARISAPLYNIALVLLALSFLVRGQFQRMGYGRKIAICAVTGFVIRLAGFGVASASETDPGLNVLQYIFPLLVIAGCLWYLFNPNKAGGGVSRMFRDVPSKVETT